jgi:HSP20 family molecular chaperone IbpA
VDRDNVKATFTNGLLEVAIPKREEAKPRQIQIAAGSEPKTVDVKAR